MAATFLLIHDAPKTIQYTQIITNFTILAKYVLHDEKMLQYIEHVLYRLKKTKIIFGQYRLINSKLY